MSDHWSSDSFMGALRRHWSRFDSDAFADKTAGRQTAPSEQTFEDTGPPESTIKSDQDVLVILIRISFL